MVIFRLLGPHSRALVLHETIIELQLDRPAIPGTQPLDLFILKRFIVRLVVPYRLLLRPMVSLVGTQLLLVVLDGDVVLARLAVAGYKDRYGVCLDMPVV